MSKTKWPVRLLLLGFIVGICSCGSKNNKENEEAAAEPEVEILDPSVIEELELEEKQLEKIRKGWKAKTYRATRKGLVKTALGLIGAVEGQSAHPLLKNLPPDIQTVIATAGEQAGGFKDLAENPPAEVGLVVATGYLVHLQKTAALCELDLIDPEELATPGGRSGFHVVRGVTYFMHGLKQHGLRDLRTANVGSAKNLAPEVRKAMYLGAAAAAIAADEPRMARTQLEMAEELSPGDPAIVFLRAEREISKSRFDDAAEMLGEWRKKNPSEDGVVPSAIDERIADLRKGDDKMTSVLADPKWIVDFGLDYIEEQAKTSEAFAKLNEVTGTARSMMDELLEQFTGFGL